MIMSVLAVNKQNFESVVNSEKPVLLDFYADLIDKAYSLTSFLRNLLRAGIFLMR